MGVELRSFQRRFQTLMGDVKPQIRPRIVVWLDERLAEFKVKGRMELSETLEDPKWIKDYNTSKRESKAAAIKNRGKRDSNSVSSLLIQPKLEEKSESSNGIAYHEELSEKQEVTPDPPELLPSTEPNVETGQEHGTEPGFQLVEVKSEQVAEDDDDDDMIIVGESYTSPEESVPSQYNPMRQMYGFVGRSGRFQRKRPRFGSTMNRPMKTSRLKPNIQQTSPSTTSTPGSFPSHSSTSYPSHTVTSQSESFTDDSASFHEPHTTYPGNTPITPSSSFPNELLRIPPHLQAQAIALDMQENIDYQLTEGDSYADYGEESYDSSYIEGESSLMYDEEGNVVIKGQGQGDDSSTEPVPGTSGEGASSQVGMLRSLQRTQGQLDFELIMRLKGGLPVTRNARQQERFDTMRLEAAKLDNSVAINEFTIQCGRCGKTLHVPSDRKPEKRVNYFNYNRGKRHHQQRSTSKATNDYTVYLHGHYLSEHQQSTGDEHVEQTSDYTNNFQHSDVYDIGDSAYQQELHDASVNVMLQPYESSPKKTYSCNVCGYQTRDGSNFRRHNLLHENRKPYQCEYCDYTARQPSNMKAHMVRKHRAVVCLPSDAGSFQVP